MTTPSTPPKPRGWLEAVREAALRFNDRLSQPVFLGPPAQSRKDRAPDRLPSRAPVGRPTREAG